MEFVLFSLVNGGMRRPPHVRVEKSEGSKYLPLHVKQTYQFKDRIVRGSRSFAKNVRNSVQRY